MASAQTAITAGDLVVLQASDGTTGTAQSVSLLEFTPSSTATTLNAGQTISVPSSTTGATNEFAIAGSSTAGGSLSVNANNTVTFAGYRTTVGATGFASGTTFVNRVVGSLDLTTGNVDTNLNLTGSTNTFRSAALNDAGTAVFLSGANGIQVSTPTTTQPTSPSAVATTSALLAGNTRQVATFNGNLFTSSGSSAPGVGVFQVGSGEPTTGTQTGTLLATATGNQYNSFAFAREGTGTAYNGFDTIYAVNNNASGTSSVQKFTYSGTGSSFAASGSITLAGVNDIAIRQNSASSVDLFVTTASFTTSGGVSTETSTIQALTDASGFNGAFTGTFTTLLTDTGNQAFYGIAFDPVPVPEPATVFGGILLVGAFGWNQRRRVRGLAVSLR